MNDTKNETVRFSMKPNPVFYALEVTRHMLFFSAALGGILLVFLPVLLLTTYVPLGLTVFIVAFVTARHLMFVVTDKRAIVRRSSGETTTDELSIAIETVKRIETTSYGAAYGSVYLTHEESSPRENSKASEPGDPQPRPIRRAFVPIERAASIWILLSKWPSWLGFYGFKGFDEFANIISEQQNSVDGRSPVDIGEYEGKRR
jgi:hypothetical protein